MNAHTPRSSTAVSTPGAVRWIAPVLLALTLGAAQLEDSGNGSSTTAGTQPEMQAIDSVFEFWYLPAQYVNQAKELDDHIQAF